MNIHLILAMGLPMVIGNAKKERATIELNGQGYVVCRFHPNNSFYLADVKLDKWYPAHWLKRIIYIYKNHSQPK